MPTPTEYTSSYTSAEIEEAVAKALISLLTTGGTMSGSITFDAVNKGILLKDSDNNTFAGLIQNSGNLWVGARATSDTHHSGGTYISAGSGELWVSKLIDNVRTNLHILDEETGFAIDGGIDLAPSSSNPVNLGTLVAPGSYYCSSNSAADYVSDKPTANSRGFRIWVTNALQNGTNYKRQRYQEYNSLDVYERYTTNGGSSWATSWTKVQGAMVTVYSGSSAPSSSTGSDGDIYIQTS